MWPNTMQQLNLMNGIMCLNSARTQTILDERQQPLLCFLSKKIVTSDNRNTNFVYLLLGWWYKEYEI